MNVTVNPSLTKGIEVHKPKAYGKRTVPREKEDVSAHQQYKKLYTIMEKQIQEIEESAYEETFNAIVTFVNSNYDVSVHRVREVPSAVLVMGVNMPDHSNIFRLLEQEINKRKIPGTVVLQSKDCSTFLNLVQKLVSGVISKYNQFLKSESASLKRVNCNFSYLKSFYEQLPDEKAKTQLKSPRKKKASSTLQLKLKPIVLLIQDVEAFKPEVLQELIMNCNLHIHVLPIVLVFGMASAMVTLHNILSQKALSCLGIETFYSLTAIEYLTKIIQKVVLNPQNPFKLGPKAFQTIIDTVLYHDFSVSNLKHMLKFCLLEHFYQNDLTVLCCDVSDIKSELEILSNKQLQKFKKLFSVRRFLENNPQFEGSMKSKSSFQALLLQFLQRHHAHYEFMMVLLTCLHTLTKDLPGHPMGKHLREIYPLLFDECLTDLPCYKESVQLMKMLSKEELLAKLKMCVLDEVEVNSDKTVAEVIQVIKSHIEDLESVTEEDLLKEKFVCNLVDETKITSRSQLQERIKLQIKAKRSRFERCRENIIDSLSTIFRKLTPPSDLPLSEVFYFDNIMSIKQHLMPSLRITLHGNLMNPHLKLKCTCCKVADNRELSSSMPDMCILYKLYLECGKLINLRDWLEAFKSVKENCESTNINGEENYDYDTALNIRFMQTVSELQLMGFVKSTKRKTDHVERLTFGTF